MRKSFVLLLLLLGSVSLAEEPLGTRATFQVGPLELLMVNWEQPRGKNLIVVHFEAKNPSRDDHRCDWRELIWLVHENGNRMSTNYDVLVDSGTGLTRASGPFVVPKRRRVKFSVPFFIAETDLPARLVLVDGRQSEILSPR